MLPSFGIQNHKTLGMARRRWQQGQQEQEEQEENEKQQEQRPERKHEEHISFTRKKTQND